MSQDKQCNRTQLHLNPNDEKSCEYDNNKNNKISLSLNVDNQAMPQNQRRASNPNTTYRRSSKFQIEFERRNIKRAKSTNIANSCPAKCMPVDKTQFIFNKDNIEPIYSNHTNTNTNHTNIESKNNDNKNEKLALEILLDSPINSILTPSKIQSKIIQPFAAKIDAKIHYAPDAIMREFSFPQNDKNAYNIRITSPKEVMQEINTTSKHVSKTNDISKRKRIQQIKKRRATSKNKSVINESKYERRQRERLHAIAKKKKKKISNSNKIKKNNSDSNKIKQRATRKKKIEANRNKYQDKQRKKLQTFKSNTRIRKKSKSAQQVLNDMKRKKMASRATKNTTKDKKNTLRKIRKLSDSEKRKQKLQKAKNQIKRAENNLKIGKNEEIKNRNKRKKEKEKTYKQRTAKALKSEQLKKIELSSAVWNALKQLRPVQRRKIEQEIKKQLQNEKSLIIKMKEEIGMAKLKNERQQMVIKEKFEREKNDNKKEKHALILERKALKAKCDEINAFRKALQQQKRIMDAELNKNMLAMRDTKKRLDKTQQMTHQQKLIVMQQSEDVNLKMKNMNRISDNEPNDLVSKNMNHIKHVQQNEDSESESGDKNVGDLVSRIKGLVYRDVERLRKEKQKMINREHKMNMKEEEINKSEQVLDKKKRAFEREKRRLSQDLSSQAAKLVAEVTGYDGIDQQLQFNQVILKMLNHSMDPKDIMNKENNHGIRLEKIQSEKNDLQQKYNQLMRKTQKLETQLQNVRRKSVSVQNAPAPIPIPLNVSNNTPAPAPMPLNIYNNTTAPAPTPTQAPAPIPLNVSNNTTAPAPIPSPFNMSNNTSAPAPIPIAPVAPAAAPAPAPPNMCNTSAPAPFAPAFNMPTAPAFNLILPDLDIKKTKEIKPTGRAPPKDIQMRGVKWNPLRGKALDDSIFTNIKIDDGNIIGIDFQTLDRLWCKPKKNKHKKTKKKNNSKLNKKRSKIEFLCMMDDSGKKGKNANLAIGAIKKTAEQYRDMILTMAFDDEKDEARAEDLVIAIQQIVPNEKEMMRFNQHFKSEKYTTNHVKYFGIGERLWYYCTKIPLVALRCDMWKFKLQFDELCQDQYKHINVLKRTFDAIYENKNMYKIFELILVIGNYLNYGHKKNGGAQGMRLDIFDKLRDFKANNYKQEKYTLLMYLVDIVNKKHAHLSDWVRIFNECAVCGKIKCDDLETEIKSICNKVKNLKNNLQKMDQQRIKWEQEQKRKARKNQKKKENENETEGKWEEPMAPNDVFKKVMCGFVTHAQTESDKLADMFADSISKCNKLAIGMGEKLTAKHTLSDFFYSLDDIRKYWIEAQNVLKTEKKKAATKKKLVHKLQRRTSKDILKQKGIIKSKHDIQKEREKKFKFGQIAIENIIRKKVRAEIELYGGMSNISSMCRHKSIGLAELQYKCQHCGEIKQDIANISHVNETEQYNEYCHECYISPHDITQKALKWLPLNKKSDTCAFNHNGPCLVVYTQTEEKRDDLSDMTGLQKRKQFLKSKRHKTADSVSNNQSFKSLISEINYNNIDHLQLIHNLDTKYEKYAVDKIGKNLKHWHQKNNTNSTKKKYNNTKKKYHKYNLDLTDSESENENESIIYSHQIKTKKKRRKKKVSNSARKLYSQKNLFTRNPKKKKNLNKSKNIRLSLQRFNE